MKLMTGAAHLILFLVALEVTSRIDDGIRFGTPMMSRVISSEDLREQDGASIQGRPNARYQKWALNDLGLRGPPAKRERTPGTLRIVAVGGSETFGLTESAGLEYPRQLEDSLNAARGRAPHLPTFEVLNAALPGMALPSIERDLLHRVRTLQPDVVLVYPSPSFYVDRDPPHAPTDVHPAGALPLSRAFRPRVLGRLTNSIKGLLPGPMLRWLRQRDIDDEVNQYPPEWRFTSVPEVRLKMFDHDIRSMVGSIRAIGAEPVLATHGNAFMGGAASATGDLAQAWVRFYPRSTAQTLISFDSAAREVTLQVARDSGVVAVDVAASLARAPDAVYSDFVHFTDRGAARVAATLREPLIAVASRANVSRVAATRLAAP
ncbi:MAG: SGNH/GDSL hydrolase family protein [bacterium]